MYSTARKGKLHFLSNHQKEEIVECIPDNGLSISVRPRKNCVLFHRNEDNGKRKIRKLQRSFQIKLYRWQRILNIFLEGGFSQRLRPHFASLSAFCINWATNLYSYFIIINGWFHTYIYNGITCMNFKRNQGKAEPKNKRSPRNVQIFFIP